MNKAIKFVFLIVMLCIPVVIFTFLRFFGNNKFDVEVFHSNGKASPFAEVCQRTEGQHYISQKLISTPLITIMSVADGNVNAPIDNILNRLNALFGNEINLIVLATDSLMYHHAEVKLLTVQQLENAIKCELILTNTDNFVLIDNERRIRGYYAQDLDEIDRLIVETKILLENANRGN